MPSFGGVSNGRRRGAIRSLKRLRPLRFVEGPRSCELLRGLILQAAVRALCVVIDPPVLDDFAGFTDAGEPMLVQAFLLVPSVEAFDIGVLGWVRRIRKQRGALFSRRTGR